MVHRVRLFIVLFILSFGVVINAQKNERIFSYAKELEQLYNVNLLPCYRDGIVEQVSSYDRTGGNNDGFEGTYSFVGKEDGKLILADLKGPGVINRIWTPTPTNDTIEFYFDGQKDAGLKICFDDLFSGKVYPFIKPLCGNEIGGYYCYLPIPYSKSCKVMFSGETMKFYQIQYRNLLGYKVETFTGDLDQNEKNILKTIDLKWKQLAKPVNDDILVKEESFVLEPGSKQIFFSQNQSGRILGFEIDDNGYFESKYKDIILNVVWDNETIPAIHAPAADFFGYAYGKASMRSYLLGKKDGINYCYIPSPYNTATMKLIYKKREGEGQPSILIRVKVYYKTEVRNPAEEGKLYTNWNREINPPEGKFYDFLSVKGKGHYIGTIHQAQGLLPQMTEFFEGDDSTYVDGKMRIHGTGSEDYYNGGWYALLDRWDRDVSLPIHGSLSYSLQSARTGGYRFYLGDKLSFEKEICHAMEHGPVGNKYPVDYTSVAFYYAEKPLLQQIEPEERLRTVYEPDNYRFYPQLMKFSAFHDTQISYMRGINIQSKSEGGIKVFLDDIPEGRYRIYLSYHMKPTGGDFIIWQRQEEISSYKSSYSTEDKFNEKQYIGNMDITAQTNSLSIKVKNNNGRNEFEFDCIYLERIY
ncbi:MAG: DUF2961 domain-containing protein [Prevotella sp.]|jgi:hypothetical protein|nr:DUF2961 domain-containing protein [Prevotella sp.]